AALDSSDRQNEYLQSQLAALVMQVDELRKELQESRRVQAAPKAAPKTAPAPKQVPVPVPAPVPAPVVAAAEVAAPVTSTPTTAGATPAAPTTAAPTTYADAAKQGLSEAQLAIIQSMKPPPRPFKARQPANPAPKPDRPPVRVYFSGVQSGPLKVFKERMRALRVRTSQIYNISFVGKSICEFLVDASYQAKFVESMSSFTF
ncbi:hypothetical protein BGZ83_005183, partial [Gryganskiella cystojenkinii]